MDVNIVQTLLLGQINQCKQGGDVGVHAAVGQQAHKVQRRTRLLRSFDGLVDDLVFADGAITARQVDARELLVHHAAGADVQVPHFGVAHLPGRQAHRLARSCKLRP